MGMRDLWGTLVAILLIIRFGEIGSQPTPSKFLPIHEWKYLEFDFTDATHRAIAVDSGEFIPGAPVPIDVDVYYGSDSSHKIFVTIPRFQLGVPLTLGYVAKKTEKNGSPIIAPYPSWNWHRQGDCEGITSVYRIHIDPCGRLWVLDTGKLEETQICKPQLLVFSLATDELLLRYRFPDDQVKQDSIFVTPVVDVRDPEGSCRDTFVYIADVTGFALLVFDHQNVRSWRIENNLFYPYPPHGTYDIQGHTFDLMDGILGLALSPLKPNEDRTLYFHSLASHVESYVPTHIIRNFTLFDGNPEAAGRAFKAFPNERSDHSAAQAMDRNGVLFFGLLSQLAIGCWNSINYDYGQDYIETVAHDPERLQFVSGLKIVTLKSGRQQLWAMASSFQRVMTGAMSPNETNFRIHAAYVDELVRGTKCDVASININIVQQPSTYSSDRVMFPK